MTTLYAVGAVNAGGHEADCVYSIWSTVELAIAEVERLTKEGVQCGAYSGPWFVAKVTLDAQRDRWIEP